MLLISGTVVSIGIWLWAVALVKAGREGNLPFVMIGVGAVIGLAAIIVSHAI
jgi:hypothetical protein